MKNIFKVVVTVILVSLVAAACNLPNVSIGAPKLEVTPNLTLTALFNTNINIPPTVTPVYVVVTNTPGAATAVPTDTEVPTATTAPSATAVPYNPPTAVPVMQRSGPLMTAGYINFTPVIDGSWDDWKDYTTQYPVTAVVYGASNWTGAADLQASYAAVWDYNYLYIGFKVHDDIYVQNATGADIYKGDSVEILLDKDLYGDFYYHGLTSDDYQLGISGGNSDASIAPSAYLWFPSSIAGPLSNITIGFIKETGTYRIEAKIPWSDFGITPSTGLNLGFAASVSDDDNTTQNIQQSMVSSAPNRSLVDPTTWGQLELVK